MAASDTSADEGGLPHLNSFMDSQVVKLPVPPLPEEWHGTGIEVACSLCNV